MRRGFFMLLIMLGSWAGVMMMAWSADAVGHQIQPKLVLVVFDHWKTRFFGLPTELPVLLKPGEHFDPKQGRYDFAQGLQAMDIYIHLKPNTKLAKSYRRFIDKWPLYQEFFKSVDQENYGEAQSLLQQILKIDKKDPAVHFYLGSLNTHLKNYAAAEAHYRDCLTYYPGYGPAYIHLARLAKARGDERVAKAYLQDAVKRVGPNEQEGAGALARKMLETLK